jgi:hypothetical protein
MENITRVKSTIVPPSNLTMENTMSELGMHGHLQSHRNKIVAEIQQSAGKLASTLGESWLIITGGYQITDYQVVIPPSRFAK